MAAGLDFMINIQQKLGGGNAVSQLEQIEQKLKSETAELAKLEAAMKRLQKQDNVSIDDYKKLQGAIDQKKGSIRDLNSSFINLQGGAQDAGAGVEGLGSQLSALKAGPAGAAVAAVLAIVAAIVIAIVKLSEFALAAADAHRSMMLMLQGATGTAAGATAAAAAIDAVAAKSALSRDELAKFAQTLAVAGLSGKTFEASLQSLATIAAVAGPEAANKLQELIKKTKALGKFEISTESLAGLGISMEDLAKRFGMSVTEMQAAMKAGKISVEQGLDAVNAAVKKRFGDVAAKQAMGFGVQLMKLKENLAGLFRDVNIEPFLEALQDLLSLFDQNTATGKALKLMATEIFFGLFAVASAVMPYIKAFFQGLVIAVLRVYVALKPLVKSLFGDMGGKPNETLMAFFTKLGQVVVWVAIFVIGMWVRMMVPIIAGAMMVASWIGAIVAAIYGFVGALQAQWDSLKNIFSAADGGNIVDGLVAGIQAGIGRVVAAVTSLGAAAKGALKGILGIASPSKEFAKLGGFTAEGFAEGVDDGTPEAHGAMAKLATPPEVAQGHGAGARGAGAGRSLTIGHLEIHGQDGDAIWEKLHAKLLGFLEGGDLAGPEPEPV